MAKATQIKNPYNINANIIVSNNATISNAPELETIYNASSLSSGIILSNNSYFMENFSQIDNIIQLAAPINFGNTMFNTAAPITVCLFGDDNPLLFNDKTIPYIDEGKSYTGHSSIAEVHNFGNQPVSNENINTTINRSDGSVFDIPQVSPRGMRKIPLTSGDTVCCTSGYTYDRINYNWLFGNNAGINFNPIKSGATPTLLSGASISQEGCATISNQNGELLFYTNGETVYNSGNTIMSNGTGLSSSGTSTQSSIIVPKPDSNKYYIFTTDFSENPDGFEYSIVNMDAADGLGQVEAKNIKLINGPVSEKVTACNHTNCNDFWVITHTSGDSTFYTYKLSSSGLAPGPVTSIGSVHSTARGYMKTSIDGKKLVSLLYDEDIIDIFDFEASAGTISNAITITGFTFDVGPYGLEFSSDSSKFYVSDGAGEKINQFDITYTSATDMVNYAIEVASVPGASLGALQMGPDEKIYVADKDKDYLHVIHRPDGLGVQCNFQEKDFSLTGISATWGLPNMITTKDLSCDRYMYISDRNRPSFEFDFVFNDVSNVIQPKKLDYRGILYQYDTITKEFSNNKSLLNINIPHNDLYTNIKSYVVNTRSPSMNMEVWASIYVAETNLTYCAGWDPITAGGQSQIFAIDSTGVVVDAIDFTSRGTVTEFAYNSEDGYLVASSTGSVFINEYGVRLGIAPTLSILGGLNSGVGSLSNTLTQFATNITSGDTYGWVIVGTRSIPAIPIGWKLFLGNDAGFPSTVAIEGPIADGLGGTFQATNIFGEQPGGSTYCASNKKAYFPDVTNGNNRIIQFDYALGSIGSDFTITSISVSSACSSVIYNSELDEIVGISGGIGVTGDVAKLVRINPSTGVEIGTVDFPDGVVNEDEVAAIYDTNLNRIVVSRYQKVSNQTNLYVFDSNYNFITTIPNSSFSEWSGEIRPWSLTLQESTLEIYVGNYDYSLDPVYPPLQTLNIRTISDTTSKVTIPINTIDEGEYILKNYFNFPILTLISNQLGYTRSTFPNYERGSEYGLYDPERDWYFLNMFKADIPVLSITDSNAANNISNLTVTSQFTDGINSRFYYDSSSSPLVALNGGVLANNIEYTAITSGITSYIQMSFTPIINQILTMAFVSNGSTDNIYIDYYQVTSPISYGPINEQSESDKVYHNTTTSEFEYYLDMPYIGIPILVVNGNVLSYGIDWLLSTSNNKRIISLVDFVVGDLIETFYVPSTVVYGDLGNNTPVLSWSINNAPKIGYGGKFTIEFAAEEDTNFDTILYSKDVDHIIDQRSYTSSIDLTAASAGDKFIYRIKNEKTYESINGKILTSESVSNSYNVTVSNNFGEAY